MSQWSTDDTTRSSCACIFFCMANRHKRINSQLWPSSNVVHSSSEQLEQGPRVPQRRLHWSWDRFSMIKTKWEVTAPPRLSSVPATLGTSDNGSNQISSTGSQPSAAEHDCIRAVKAKVSWSVDGDGVVLARIRALHSGFICFSASGHANANWISSDNWLIFFFPPQSASTLNRHLWPHRIYICTVTWCEVVVENWTFLSHVIFFLFGVVFIQQWNNWEAAPWERIQLLAQMGLQHN